MDTSQGSLTLYGVESADNTAAWDGGAVYTQLGANNTLSVDGCAFNGNKAQNVNNPPGVAVSGFGGAIEVGGFLGGKFSSNNLEVSGSSFGGNGAATWGGAIYAFNLDAGGEKLTVTNSDFTQNTSQEGGGAIESEDQTTIANSTFESNTAGTGGGLYYSTAVDSSISLSVTYSSFTDNTAQNGDGGGIWMQALNQNAGTSSETFNGDLFNGNKALGANGEGGGIYVAQQSGGTGSATLNLFNSTFFNNFADGYGGGIYLEATSSFGNTNAFNLTSLTVYQNQASTAGGGLYVDPTSVFGGTNTAPELVNVIIADNTIENPPTEGPDIDGSIYSGSYNLIGISDGAYVSSKNGPGTWRGKDIVGTSAAPKDPGLDPNGLQDNGGPTLTIKLADDSFAKNKGKNALISSKNGTQLDQRGYKRELMGEKIQVSIGAYDPNANVVKQGQSSTSLNSSTVIALSGEPVTFTAEATTDAGTPTGTVTFEDGNIVLGTVTLDENGFASLTNSTLALGSNNITAVYSGDVNSAGSNTSLTQIISQETSTSMSLNSSSSNSTLNQAVTFTSTVYGGSGTPTGTVTFMDGNDTLGTATLDGNGNATFTTSTLALGSQTITAMYSGDATYGDNSAALTQTVSQGGTFTSLSLSANPVQPGQAVTFTANIVPEGSSGTPTGIVTFLDGTTTLGTSMLAVVGGQDQATFTTSSLSNGSHTITAIYSGDNTFMSSSSSMSETVGQASGTGSSTSVTSSANSSYAGQSVTFTASVGGSSGTPTGTVTFLDNTTVLGTATLDINGNAVLTSSALGLGSNDIVTVYSGDGTYAGSAATLTQSVVQAASTSSLSSSAPSSPLGQPVTFTVVVGSLGSYTGTPTGSVSFYDGTTLLGTATLSVVNGQVVASFTTAAMGLGTHNITAIYSGDGTFADSESSLTQTIAN